MICPDCGLAVPDGVPACPICGCVTDCEVADLDDLDVAESLFSCGSAPGALIPVLGASVELPDHDSPKMCAGAPVGAGRLFASPIAVKWRAALRSGTSAALRFVFRFPRWFDVRLVGLLRAGWNVLPAPLETAMEKTSDAFAKAGRVLGGWVGTCIWTVIRFTVLLLLLVFKVAVFAVMFVIYCVREFFSSWV